MDFQLGSATFAGAIAGVGMALPVLIAKGLRIPLQLDMPRIWDSAIRTRIPVIALGLALHLVVSMLVGLLYAASFAIVGADNYLLVWGIAGGLVHWLIAGLVITAIAAAHSQIPIAMPKPRTLLRSPRGCGRHRLPDSTPGVRFNLRARLRNAS